MDDEFTEPPPVGAVGSRALLVAANQFSGYSGGGFAFCFRVEGDSQNGGYRYRYPAALQDAVESMRQVRGAAEKWQIDPQRIGVMGFSAGGHLASTLINRPEDAEVEGRTVSDATVSPRPDVAILCYPVISRIIQPHARSRNLLVGEMPDDELLRRASSELQAHPDLPPVFLWHTQGDELVPAEHSRLYAAALEANGIPHEFHLYQDGDHGTGLIGTSHPWFADLLFWLKARKFLP